MQLTSVQGSDTYSLSQSDVPADNALTQSDAGAPVQFAANDSMDPPWLKNSGMETHFVWWWEMDERQRESATKNLMLVFSGQADYENPEIAKDLAWGVEHGVFPQERVERAKREWNAAVLMQVASGLVHPESSYAVRAISNLTQSGEVEGEQIERIKKIYYVSVVPHILATSMFERFESFEQPEAERAFKEAVEFGGLPQQIADQLRAAYYPMRGHAALIAISAGELDPNSAQTKHFLDTALESKAIDFVDLADAKRAYAQETSIWSQISRAWWSFVGLFVKPFNPDFKVRKANPTMIRLFQKLQSLQSNFVCPDPSRNQSRPPDVEALQKQIERNFASRVA